ncbi:MAG: FadR family transcriptional regulator [Bacteroidetes bacterium]|nr:FadR family transcriptional regulator [Bacteroidota bacterium]
MEEQIFSQLASRQPISHTIANQIEDAILSKRFPPGSKLPSEAELCKQFGVSRTSVREALRILNTHGLVSIEKGKGVFVLNFSSENVTNIMLKFFEHRLEGDYAYDLVHARQMIEPGIAYFAAQNRTEEDLTELRDAIDGISNNVTGDLSIHTKYDLKFHLDLAKASKNKFMPLLLRPLQRLIPKVKSNILSFVDDARKSALIHHQIIYDFVEKNDSVGARRAMTEHLKIAEEHISRAFKEKEL